MKTRMLWVVLCSVLLAAPVSAAQNVQGVSGANLISVQTGHDFVQDAHQRCVEGCMRSMQFGPAGANAHHDCLTRCSAIQGAQQGFMACIEAARASGNPDAMQRCRMNYQQGRPW